MIPAIQNNRLWDIMFIVLGKSSVLVCVEMEDSNRVQCAVTISLKSHIFILEQRILLHK